MTSIYKSDIKLFDFIPDFKVVAVGEAYWLPIGYLLDLGVHGERVVVVKALLNQGRQLEVGDEVVEKDHSSLHF